MYLLHCTRERASWGQSVLGLVRCADETVRDPPEAKIGFHLIICYFVNCLSLCCLSLAGDAGRRCKPTLQPVSLPQLLLGSIPCSSDYPRRAADPPLSQLRGIVTLPCLFFSVQCLCPSHVQYEARLPAEAEVPARYRRGGR